jgi:hypothetical protein
MELIKVQNKQNALKQKACRKEIVSNHYHGSPDHRSARWGLIYHTNTGCCKLLIIN